MTKLVKFLTAAAAIGAISASAAAQYPYPAPYPPPPYPGYGYPGYGQNPIGTIIDQLLGNRYNVTDRGAVSQCAAAAVAQAQNQYRGYGYGYNQPYGGYNQPYGYNAFRVTAITDVERRSSGLRVSGLMTSPGGYGYNQGYGELSFRCNVDYRGYVTNVRVSPNIRRY